MVATRTGTAVIGNDSLMAVTWTGLLNGDDGKAAQIGRFADKSAVAYGTFGVGGAVAIEGSWDGGTTWGALHDPQGTVISLVSADPLSVIAESPPLIRARVTAGDGSTNLTVEIAAVATR